MKLPIKVAISVNKCDSGGQKSLTMGYLRNLDKNKVVFHLICDADSNSIPYDEVKELGGVVHVIPPYQQIGKHIKALRKIFKEEKFDVLHAMNNTMNIFPLFVAKEAGIKVRISESLSMASRHELKKSAMKIVLKQFAHLFCNYYVACGKDCGAFQFGKKALYDGKIEIFKTCIDARTNTYDEALRSETRIKFGWEDQVVYGFIGRFAAQKNPMFLIDIMNGIHKLQENAQFVIIGAGELEYNMKERIALYHLQDSVSWLGRREDIRQFYNAFDAFLLPSLYEGLPVVGLEAQASGLPVFFSDKITREAAACDLAHFLSLNETPDNWAKYIITSTAKNINVRCGHEQALIDKGFDTVAETRRLTDFWLNAVKEQEGGEL